MNRLNALIEGSAPTLVEFYATWCPHCKRMMPVVEQIKELLAGSADVYQLDIDANRELADIEQVTATPTFVLYRHGQEVWRESGEMDGQLLLAKIESYL